MVSDDDEDSGADDGDATLMGQPATVDAPEGDDVSACLLVLSGGAVGRVIKVPRSDLRIGRGSDLEVSLDDEGISRNHARIIQREDGTVVLQDLGSRNGTRVNGSRITERALENGDRVEIGTVTILKFNYQDSLEGKFLQQLYESATQDPLTELHNRRYFFEQLGKEVRHVARHRIPLGLAILDVDRFKRINDTLGHLAGDAVLRQVASVLKTSSRADECLCRIGGEEFALILRDCDRDGARTAAERLRGAVEAERFTFGGDEVEVTISAGVAAFGRGESGDASNLFEAADKQLYRAKHAGRNRVCVADDASG